MLTFVTHDGFNEFVYYAHEGDPKENARRVPVDFPFLLNPEFRRDLIKAKPAFKEVIQNKLKELNNRREELRQELAEFDFVTTPFKVQMNSLFNVLLYKKYGLFDDTGMGKTKVFLDMMKFTGGQYLIVTRTFLVDNIVFESQIHRPELKFARYKANRMRAKYYSKEVYDTVNNGGHLIINFENLNKHMYSGLKIGERNWKGLIVDESDCVKNAEIARTQNVIAIADKCEYVVVSTGTPSLGTSLDVYSQMRILSPFIFGKSFYRFRNKFCIWERKKLDYGNDREVYTKYKVYHGPKNMKSFKEMIRPFYIRHMKRTEDYPARTVKIIVVEETGAQRQMEKRVREAKLPDHYTYPDPAHVSIQNMKCLEIASGHLALPRRDEQRCEFCDWAPPKAVCRGFVGTPMCTLSKDDLKGHSPLWEKQRIKTNKVDHIRNIIDSHPDQPILIYYQYTEDLKIIKEVIEEYKAPIYDMGSVNAADKIQHLNEYKVKYGADQRYFVLCQISGAVGWTFIECRTVIYYSRSHNYRDYKQSRDRVYRRGQTRKVMEYILVTEGTLEERLHGALQRKEDFVLGMLYENN